MKVVGPELVAGPHLVDSGADDARAEPFGQIEHARVKGTLPERVVGLAADCIDDVHPVSRGRGGRASGARPRNAAPPRRRARPPRSPAGGPRRSPPRANPAAPR